jgi:hypothetical protein
MFLSTQDTMMYKNKREVGHTKNNNKKMSRIQKQTGTYPG